MAWRRERRFVIIWPIYFDKDKSRSNGRKVSKKYAVNKPNIALLSNIIKKLGYDFEVDGWAASYGIYESFHGDAILTGILANGDSLNTTIQIRDDAQLILAIPEPATLLLLGLGAVVLRRKH